MIYVKCIADPLRLCHIRKIIVSSVKVTSDINSVHSIDSMLNRVHATRSQTFASALVFLFSEHNFL